MCRARVENGEGGGGISAAVARVIGNKQELHWA